MNKENIIPQLQDVLNMMTSVSLISANKMKNTQNVAKKEHLSSLFFGLRFCKLPETEISLKFHHFLMDFPSLSTCFTLRAQVLLSSIIISSARWCKMTLRTPNLKSTADCLRMYFIRKIIGNFVFVQKKLGWAPPEKCQSLQTPNKKQNTIVGTAAAAVTNLVI